MGIWSMVAASMRIEGLSGLTVLVAIRTLPPLTPSIYTHWGVYYEL